MASPRKTINLALQGGGSHGAFTWGVLDALLEDGRLDIEGISGASAGAMNAVVLAHGLAQASEQGLSGKEARAAARAALGRFWDGVGVMGTLMTGVPLKGSQALLGFFSQWVSPYQTNPLGINPLRRLLEREIDFELLARQQTVKVFMTATNVRTGRGEVFTGERVTADAVMASACLPMLFKAVEIDGEHYWDGGYSGNPAIYPLIYKTAARDVLLVQINPVEAPTVPSTAQEIMERINEITFNAGLLAEMRAIDFVQRLLAEGKLDPRRYKNLLLHRIDGGRLLADFGASSKMRTDTVFIQRLFALGREAGAHWLKRHYRDIGVRAGIDTAHNDD